MILSFPKPILPSQHHTLQYFGRCRIILIDEWINNRLRNRTHWKQLPGIPQSACQRERLWVWCELGIEGHMNLTPIHYYPTVQRFDIYYPPYIGIFSPIHRIMFIH
jgi:hypothetical protein